MKVLFRFHDVSDDVEETRLEPYLSASGDHNLAFRRKDNKALFIIHQCVDDTHFEKI